MTRSGMPSWPDDVAARYVDHGYWRKTPLGSLPAQWARRYGDRTALVDGETQIDYRTLAQLVDRLAAGLAALGLDDGDNVVVQLPNCHQLVVVVLACARLGVAPVLMLPAHREHEMVAVARHVDAAAIVVPTILRGHDHQAMATKVARQVSTVRLTLVVGDGIREPNVDLDHLLRGEPVPATTTADLDRRAPDPFDVALFLLSGGSTGTPKIISRTHNDYEYNARRSAEVCGFGPDTRYLVVLPAGHNFPLGSPGILGTLMSGGRVVLLPSPSPDLAFRTIARERVTHVAVVPAVVRRWVDTADRRSDDLCSLAVLQVGGSRFDPDLAAQAARTFGCRVQQVFGMAEGMLNFTRLDDGDEIATTTQGRPISPHDELLIVGPDGRPVPDGEPGELLVRGPYTVRGYFAAPAHNAGSFLPDGWYRTGDVVRAHPSGNLVVVGRKKDVINRGSEKIAADEIEQLVATLPSVAEAAAVPVPDRELGERVCVFVVPRSGHRPSLAEIGRLFAEHGVAGFKMPERLEIVDSLPYTPIGKIDKQDLRERTGYLVAG